MAEASEALLLNSKDIFLKITSLMGHDYSQYDL
jgi:hypothetical protein